MTKTHCSPILTSLLDTDAYKLHMQQAVFHHYDQVPVIAEFRCRSDDNLGEFASQIAEQVQLMQQLALTDDEYHYLRTLPFFKTDYLDWLRNYRYQPEQVKITHDAGKLRIKIEGLWRDIILWEVPLLAIISEIVHRHITPNITTHDAVVHLQTKLQKLCQVSQNIDMSDFNIVDFGTRRRYSYDVQHAIIDTLKHAIPNWFGGTSNYAFAQQFDLPPVGTQAHEWFQAFQQISPVLANSQRAALQSWLDEYPNHLGIALTDCIAMDAFLRDFNDMFAKRYVGLRHDSGDPILWGEKALAHYENLGIDPKTKTLVFSDSLDFDNALQIYRHFHQRIKLVFGIGTKLTCDIPGVTPLNIVIKLTHSNGKPVAKISDSPGKSICQDESFIKALHKAFDLPLNKK